MLSHFDPARLRTLRKSRGITAVELATRMSLSPAQIHRIEKGQRRLTVDGLLAYCHALGTEIGALFRPHIEVPVTGVIDSEFQIQPLPPDSPALTPAPPLISDMQSVAALRWAASRRFQPMLDHLVFYKPYAGDPMPEFAWNKRCLITRRDGSECLGWPIRDQDRAHIDVGDGPVEFSVEIIRAAPVIAVMPPFAIEGLVTPNEP
ncbi:MAG: helix-turn-helix domain-containing protein [Pseudomonadota bacterium]